MHPIAPSNFDHTKLPYLTRSEGLLESNSKDLVSMRIAWLRNMHCSRRSNIDRGLQSTQVIVPWPVLPYHKRE